MSTGYRREIDGLRAFAVLPVILFHAGLGIFPGGFTGVDVFFVISGYLIGGILIRELQEGRFSIIGFYERRARRILPALALVMLCCIPFAWAWMLPLEMKDFAQSVAAAALSVSNLLFWLEADYFDRAAELKPLLHSWSLGVEEQFYLLLPPALLLLWRWPMRRRMAVIALVALGSLALCMAMVRVSPAAAFYLLPFRAWELLAGTLCALWHLRNGQRGNGPLAALGLGAIVASVLVLDTSTPFPSAYALLPVTGSCLVLLFATPEGWAGRLLTLAPVVGIGLISYSAYLWHQPLLAFGRLYSLEAPTQGSLLAIAAASLPLAYLSWRFVEQPFRRRGPGALLPGRAAVLSLSAALIVAAVVFGALGHVRGGMPGRYTAEQQAFLKLHEWPRRCLFTRLDPLPVLPVPACRFLPATGHIKGRVALVGDSVMSSISPAAIRYLTAEGYMVEQFTHSHCTLNRAHHVNDIDAVPCPAFISRVTDYIAAQGFDLVISAGAFQNKLAQGKLSFVRTDGATATTDSFGRDFAQTAAATGTRLLLIEPHPRPEVDIRDRAVRQMRTHGSRTDYTMGRAAFVAQVSEIRALLEQSLPEDSLRVDPGEGFCSGDLCHFVHSGVPLLSDRTHFTDKGAQYALMPLLETVLKDSGY
ncbi:acyltransferase [Salipiger pacificus]|nr:acyltransferase [Alloyangia pacifica]MCA0946071.1 acyltransferase [Alloyangia pacifica]